MTRPDNWPRFRSPLRSTAVTARLGRWVGICFGICFVTGMLSHYQYHPWSWLPEPATPVWGYRLTQGIHVATGTATVPLLLVKLWSVYPNLFRWPVVRSVKHAAERLSVFVLVGSALVQLVTGFLNTLHWYLWPWDFASVHRFLAYVVIGSILLHISIKLPDIRYGLSAKVADADVLTEIPWQDNPASHTNAGDTAPPRTDALTRRGLLIAVGTGIGTVLVTTVGETITPLSPLGLLANRQASSGPAGVPVNRTALEAGVMHAARSPRWRLHVHGPSPFLLSEPELLDRARTDAHLPIACVEGWSVGASWRGVPLLDIVREAGGNSDSRVHAVSLETGSPYNNSFIEGPQLAAALLATHLNGERLDLDHGFPVRLIAPDRAGVLNTKWLHRIEIR
jgi:hypothetical protein